MSAQFLPLTFALVETAIVDQSVWIVPSRIAKPASPRKPAPIAGAIEIKFGGATERIDGVVNASILAAVLSHFHP